MSRQFAGRWIIALIVVLIIIIIAYHAAKWREKDRFSLDRTRGVRGFDGLEYRVHLIHENAKGAANTMAILNARVVELLRFLRAKYLRTYRKFRYPGRAAAVRRLLGLYNPDNLAENSPRDPEGDTSYTIDKGAILALCLRKKDSAGHDIHDLETLTFVTFHELSHIAIEDFDHPPRFWRAFRFILEDSQQAKLLRGVDYGKHPTVYCGMDIDYNPLFDQTVAPLV